MGFWGEVLLAQLNWVFWELQMTMEITSSVQSHTVVLEKRMPLHHMLGVHEFDPGQQLIFIGETTSVTNNVNFIDKSSFIFKGKVRYDSRGVFKSFVEVDPSRMRKRMMVVMNTFL